MTIYDLVFPDNDYFHNYYINFLYIVNNLIEENSYLNYLHIRHKDYKVFHFYHLLQKFLKEIFYEMDFL